jgi:hypothetical protein
MNKIISLILLGISLISTSVLANEASKSAKNALPSFEVKDGIVVYSDYSNLPFTLEEQKDICAKAEKKEYEVIPFYSLEDSSLDKEIFLNTIKDYSRFPTDGDYGCNDPEDPSAEVYCMKFPNDTYSKKTKDIICYPALLGQTKNQCLINFLYIDYGRNDYTMCEYEHLYLYDETLRSMHSMLDNMINVFKSSSNMPCTRGKQKLVVINSKIYVETYNHAHNQLAGIDYIEIQGNSFKDYPMCKNYEAYQDNTEYEFYMSGQGEG